MKKRLISTLLSLILVLGLACGTFAAGTEVSAEWTNFRNSDVNFSITEANTPTDMETTVLKWATRLGTGFSYPGAPILVDNALVVMCANKVLYKLDLQTGAILQQADMSAASSAYTAPTYAAGIIFCPQNSGTVQAFDAKTLESLWVYQDELGGQGQSPVAYADGYVYTGFWNSETKDANFVCLKADDGRLVWKKTVAGGYYWAGSVVVNNAVIVGTDDGKSGYTGDSHVYSLNKNSGDVISELTLTGCGDQRSAIAYSKDKGRIYFTTKNGFLASAALNDQTGALSDLKTVKQANQCTGTPVIYGNHVYFTCGSGVVLGSGGTGNFVVADADTLAQLYTVPMIGYPQGSVLISDAYLQKTGKLYCYSTYNARPGGLTLIKVDPTKNTSDGAELVEIYDAKGYEQYCITSPICGKDGTIYYKNDTGNVLAVGVNNAYLADLTADVGTFAEAFRASAATAELIVPVGTKAVTFTPVPCRDGSVTVNGAAATTPVALTDGTATAEIIVTKGTQTRTYTVSIREVFTDATLGELKVNESNTYGGTALALSEEFSAQTRYYSVLSVGASRAFDNVWPTAANAKATVAVYPIENVDASKSKVDAETGKMAVTATNQNHDRYAVYFADGTKPAAIRVVVTAENGDKMDYVLVLSKAAAKEDGAALLEKIKADDITAADQAAADAVAEKIAAVGTVSLSSKNAISAARAAYSNLTEKQKTLVTNYDVLTAAEAALKQLKTEATATPVHATVTISVKGTVVLSRKNVTVTDINDNGMFDVDDALYAAHEAGFDGGAQAGYVSGQSPYYEGRSIYRLWGNDEGSYGYWRNNASCWSLEDKIAEGDEIVAFVYADVSGYSDAYSYFDKPVYSAVAGAALTVKLNAASGYDENWNTLFSAYAGANVKIYDAAGKEKTDGCAVTDNGDGTYTVTFADAGNYTVVAFGNNTLTVPAVSSVTVISNPPTGDALGAGIYSAAAVLSFAGMIFLFLRKKPLLRK